AEEAGDVFGVVGLAAACVGVSDAGGVDAAGHAHGLDNAVDEGVAGLHESPPTGLGGVSAPVEVSLPPGVDVGASEVEGAELLEAEGDGFQGWLNAPGAVDAGSGFEAAGLFGELEGIGEGGGGRAEHPDGN